MKFSKIIFLLFLPLFSFSQVVNEDMLKNFFSTTYTYHGPCKAECRSLTYTDLFVTKIVDFDASTGITSCEVFPKASADNEVVDIIQTIC